MFNVWLFGRSIVVAVESNDLNRAIVQIMHSQDRFRPCCLIQGVRVWVGVQIVHAQDSPRRLNKSDHTVVGGHEGHDGAGRI